MVAVNVSRVLRPLKEHGSKLRNSSLYKRTQQKTVFIEKYFLSEELRIISVQVWNTIGD